MFMLVVKAGGAVGTDLAAICTDIASLVQSGERIILVHGGSTEADALGEQLGHPPRFLMSVSGVRSRYTDPATLDVLTMAMAGRIQPLLIKYLLRAGVMAVGMIGIDGALIQAQRKSAIKIQENDHIQIVHDDLTGHITEINTHLLHLLLNGGYVPVVAPPAVDVTIGLVNVDADRAAAAIAIAMGAEKLLLLSNVPGVLHDPSDPTSLIEEVSVRDLPQCLAYAQGRMKLKVIAAQEALAGRVRQVVIGDSRLPHPVYQALKGKGTVLKPALPLETVSPFQLVGDF